MSNYENYLELNESNNDELYIDESNNDVEIVLSNNSLSPNVEFQKSILSVTTFQEFKEKLLYLKSKDSYHFSIYLNRIHKWAESNNVDISLNPKDPNYFNNLENKISVASLIKIVSQPPPKKKKRKLYQISCDISESEEISDTKDKTKKQNHNVALMASALLHEEVTPLMYQVFGKISENTLDHLNVGAPDIRKEKWELIRTKVNDLAPQIENTHKILYPELAIFDPK